MTQYSILLTLPAATVQSLVTGGFRLYVFKAVHSGASGQVLVWNVFRHYLENTLIGWDTGCSVLLAAPGMPLNAGTRCDVRAGQKVVIQSSGVPVVLSSTDADTIGIENQADQPVLTGLAQQGVNEEGQPSWRGLSAFVLNGQMEQTLAPAEKVLLAFSTADWKPGQPIDSLVHTHMLDMISGGGLLVDMAEAADRQRTVSYIIDRGWDCQQQTWATPVPASAPLARYLLLPDA